ncbi:MAG: hypothetical protein WCO23_01025 [bacterium]
MESQHSFSGDPKGEFSSHKENMQNLGRKESVPDSGWLKYDSPLLDSALDPTELLKGLALQSFNRSYEDLIPMMTNEKATFDLKKYIETLLEDRAGQALGVEFGGPARRLFDGFTPEFFAKSAGVTLTDPEYFQTYESQRGEKHRVIEGDMFSQSTMQEVYKWFDNQQIDLIITRLIGGTEYLPTPNITIPHLKRCYRLLKNGGVILTDLPDEFSSDNIWKKKFIDWLEMVRVDFEGVIDIEVSLCQRSMRLNKLTGAPQELPLLQG